MTALHIMTVMHTMTSSYGMHTLHAKKTEIPKGFSEGPLQAVYGRIGILVLHR